MSGNTDRFFQCRRQMDSEIIRDVLAIMLFHSLPAVVVTTTTFDSQSKSATSSIGLKFLKEKFSKRVVQDKTRKKKINLMHCSLNGKILIRVLTNDEVEPSDEAVGLIKHHAYTVNIIDLSADEWKEAIVDENAA